MSAAAKRLDQEVRDYAAAKLRAGFSLQDIARITGRPVVDIRQAFAPPAEGQQRRTYLSLWLGEIAAPEPRLTMAVIQAEVEASRGLAPGSLLIRRQTRDIAHARHEFMWRCRQVLCPDGSHRYSLHQIRRHLRMKDHTSVINGARRHEQRLAEAQP